ncbi:MAG: RHS repeat-associated core domain-containing protein, partial [Bacteroidales bacterium]|nr:RHS repeat-associated core domain-containing protein [Bacteroidales bacterium]
NIFMHTAKELEKETSYTYFGARYYDSELSGWLSVDPMSDKYPSTSAYMYCSGNPVILIDPNGMWIINPPSKEDYERCNVSEQAQQRFESILHNIEIFSKNENFINAFSLTTGLSKDKIIEYLTYGKGPSITLIEGSDAHANDANNFTLGADILNYLGSIDNNDIEKLALSAFGVAMVLIDELSHCGDMEYNKVNTSTGENINNPGNQTFKLSPTKHRGGDSQIFGFGVKVGVVAVDFINAIGIPFKSGQVIIEKPNPSDDIVFPSSNLPTIPQYNIKELKYIGLDLLNN